MNITGLMNETDFLPTTEGVILSEAAEAGGASGAAAIPTSVMVVGVLQGIITFVGLLGNALVVFVLIMARDRQDTSSVIYVLNLAVADLLLLATVPFKIERDMTLIWRFGEFMCKFAGGFVTYLNFFVSPLFLMVMSIDRYLAVNKAVSSAKLRAVKSSRYVSIGVWLIAVCAVVPIALLHTTYPEQLQCKPKFPGYETNTLGHRSYCENQKLYAECTHNYVMNKTLASHAALLSNDVPSEDIILSRMKRDIEPTTKSSKRRQNKQEKNKKRRKSGKNKKRKNKNKNLKTKRYGFTSTVSPMSALPMKSSELEVSEVPNSVRNGLDVTDEKSKMTTLQPLDDIMEFEKGFLMENIARSSPVMSFKSNTSIKTSLQATSTDFQTMSGFTTVFDFNLEMEAARECLRICSPKKEQFICIHYEPYSFKVWIVLNFFYSYLIPCSAIVICYVAILRKLYQPSGMAHQHESRGRIRRKAMRTKVTLMVALLVISYIVCFTPYYIWQIIQIPGVPVSSHQTCQHMRRFNATMAYVNSALNPLLYTFLSEQFGSKLRLAWRRITRKTAYHIGTIKTAREKNSSGHKNRDSDKRNNPIIPRDKNPVKRSKSCNGSSKVEEEDQRHLMEEISNNSKSNGNVKIVVVDVANPDELAEHERKENDKNMSGDSGVFSAKRSSRNSLLSWILDCATGTSNCPECAIQISSIDKTKDEDGVTKTIEMTSLDVKSNSIQRRRRIRSEDDFVAADLCRKHKKCLRRNSKKNSFQSLENHSGRWRPMSFSEDSKFLTEATVL